MDGVVGFRRGFWAMAPLWLGVVPFALVYAVLARDTGLSLLETQALSALVFAGSAQVSAVGLFGSGAAALEIVSTTFLLNVRHVLYGLSLGRRIPLSRRQRPVAAYFLTDEAFGVVSARGERTLAFLLGADQERARPLAARGDDPEGLVREEVGDHRSLPARERDPAPEREPVEDVPDVQEEGGRHDPEGRRPRPEEADGADLRAACEHERGQRLRLEQREPGITRKHGVDEREGHDAEPERGHRPDATAKCNGPVHPAIVGAPPTATNRWRRIVGRCASPPVHSSPRW